jgi:amidase
MRHSKLSAFGIAAAALLSSLMSTPAHASANDPLMSISQILQAQSNGSLTCVAIAQHSLAEIHRLNSTLKVFITVNPNLMSDAAKLDALRRAGTVLPLHCVTIAVKDNIDVAGMPTTGGSVLLAHNRPTHDADVVRRLRAAGALFVGKANLDELAVAGSTISSLGGQTLNPYDTTRFAAGSSGGPAVSASTGISTCSIGTETVNSLRNAASSAGVVAVRTTHGLVSRTGVIPQSSSMDVVGPLCRNVEDTVRMLEQMAGRDPSDPQTTANEGLHTRIALANLHAVDLKGVRIGVLEHLFSTQPDGAPVNDILQSALDKLRAAGAQIVPIEDPEFDSATSSERMNVANYEFRPLFDAYLASIKPVPGVANTQDYYNAHRFPEQTMGPFLKNAVSWRDPLHMPDYLAALQYTVTFKAKVLRLMDAQKLDALVYPSQKRPPLLLTDKPRAERNGVFASALGFPAVDLPAGFTKPTANAPEGLPIGIDLFARPYDDMKLLNLALAIETTLNARRSPPLAHP